MIRFFVSGVPVGKGSGRAIISKTTKKAMFLPASSRTKEWENQIKFHAGMHKPVTPYTEGVAIRTSFVTCQPKSAKWRKHPTVKPDIDKLVRTVLDALTGIYYVDDCQVVQLEASKMYGDSPGVMIECWSLFS